MRINEELVEFWHAIFIAAQKLQEQGKPADYANITQRMLRLSPGIVSRIPDLCGVDIDYTMIESWLEEETAPPEERAKRRTRYESLSNMRECTLPYEQWLPIINHKDYYISNLGRVWSLKRRDGLMTPQLKNRTDRRNKKKLRLYVQLRDNGKKYLVHRLVAEHFVPNPLGLPEVDHINEDPQDNRVSNLRWVTGKENIESYMKSHGYWYKDPNTPKNL